MQDNLVIVESPAKAKTLEKFLGKDFIVKSSYGHIRDLAKKDLGIDLDNDFNPHYEISPDKKKVVDELTKAAKKAKTVWLASDEDREGEAIAWHLAQVLELPVDSTRRIVFHEITKNAILNAIDNPRHVDMNLVNSQQARRILDRLVGFELSPVLWRKVKPSLSAGRVQSVAVRLIVEREREIIDFKAETYYRVTAEFVNTSDNERLPFKAVLNTTFDTHEKALDFVNKCRDASFSIVSCEKKPGQRSPAPPFTTSTLQQEAARKFSMSVSQTMSVAQRLYENGLITYMRTDSMNLSKEAIAASKSQIVSNFGAEYSKTRNYKTKAKGAQEAHEAIRPSYFERSEIDGTPAEKKLYDLIWKRTVASQMASAQIEKTIVNISLNNAEEIFVATGEVILFDGFLKLYSESLDDDHAETDEMTLPAMNEGDILEHNNITAQQSFTRPPARFSEASLVKRLEDLGIGRPSTYAPTISTIINRGYVIKQSKPGVKREYEVISLKDGKITEKVASENTGSEKNRLSPTDIGMVVNDYLESQFSEIMDYNFTASVEKEFDEIAEGKKQWQKMLSQFYDPFHKSVEKAMDTTQQRPNQARVLGIDPASGHEVTARLGRYGPIVQIDGAEGEKPRFASLKKGQLIATITLEDALELFALPRTLGEIDGKEVTVSIGRYGPYVKYDGKFTSLAKTDDPYTIDLQRAAQLIEEKKEGGAGGKKTIKTFDENADLMIMNGRYGPYISFEGKNFRIPKDMEPSALTASEALEIVQQSKDKKKKK